MKDGKADRCIFCGKKKTWDSYMTIFVDNKKPVGFTICPEDREKHTVQELYERVITVAAKIAFSNSELQKTTEDK
jgi:hypothetical protein